MNKKLMKVLSILLISIMMVSTMSTMVLAAGEGTITSPADINGEITDGSGTGTMTTAQQRIGTLGNNIVGVLRTVGIVLSVVVLVIIGIKYMMGSPEEKSEYKKSMMPYIIGAALIFAASVFADVIYGFFVGMNVQNP